ncbi:hypothetical protein [Nocardiopsis sp. HUAS JQ3]|uniref:hypothetical protein n=1 Tax=Nocardiopsis sp. HUAS JQ3 TaxID=3061629 RepID=UPI0023A9B812|nr:hypothetical protein [Nocardiopsis sp. HUAS JQ3]WDZ92945.1 hypothetical protein PV789_10625 [Nocardiopsis sp. HUAS JQ3]
MAAGDNGFRADPDGMTTNSQKVREAAEYARETEQWLDDALAPLQPIWGEGDDFAKQMDKSLGELKTSLSELTVLIATAAEDSSDILLKTTGSVIREEENNTNHVPDLNTPDGTGGGRR